MLLHFIRPIRFNEVAAKWLFLLLTFAAMLSHAHTAAADVSDDSSTTTIATVLLEGITDADTYGRQLVTQLKKQIEEEERHVVRVHIIWVSPDKHPSPKLEAVMRLIHLGLQPAGVQAPKHVIVDTRYTPEEFSEALELGLNESIENFHSRLLLSKALINEGAGQGYSEPVRQKPIVIIPAEYGFVRRLYIKAKAMFLEAVRPVSVPVGHALGVPNSFKVIDYFRFRNIPPRKRLLANLAVAGLQLSLQYVIADHFLRETLGEGFGPAMVVSAISTLYFGIFSEASLKQRSQGVAYNSKDGMGISRSFLMTMTFLHSLLVRVPTTIAGFGWATTPADLLQTTETSVKSTFTKSVWERGIQRLMDRDAAYRTKRMLEGRPWRRPEWLETGFLLNKALVITNSTAAYIDQFGVVPGLKNALLVLGAGGLAVEVAYKERDRTGTAWRRFVRRISGQDPDQNCEAYLLVEYADGFEQIKKPEDSK